MSEPVGFAKRPDGTTYPIHAPKKRSKGPAVAVGVALVLSAGGGTTAAVGGAAGSSTALSAAESAVVRGIQSNVPKAKKAARQGKPKQAWGKLRLRQGRERMKNAAECWARSFGQVQEFFAHRPCRELQLLQFPVVDSNGNTISVLVSRIRMSKAADAYKFRRLIDEHGTGDIRPILPDVPFTGHHYDSTLRGKSVIVAETEPRHGNPPEAELDAIAEAAVAFAPR